MADQFKAYKKCFICTVQKNFATGFKSTHPIFKNILMKVSIVGVIVAVKKFSERTIFSVDDGTGIIDCSIWLKSPNLMDKISKLKETIGIENVASTSKCERYLLSILNRTEKHELIHQHLYELGDMVSFLGNLKVIRNIPLLDIQHHNKINDVNGETLWILENLMKLE